MKIKFFTWTTLLALALFGMNCSSGGSPVSPNAPMPSATSGADLFGIVSVADSSIGMASIQVGIKGTTSFVTPNSNGEFALNNLPLGNATLDIMTTGMTTGIQLNDVKCGEEIRIRLEIRSNGQAHLAHMERHNDSDGDLSLAIKPGKWNLDWEESEDDVSASLSGQGYDTILETSVEVFGPDGIRKIDNADLVINMGGKYFKAVFSQKNAIGLIDSPVSGAEYPIKVTGTYGEGEPFELYDTILILGKYCKDTEELAAQINPPKWNVNWKKSSGTMMVKFWGDGYNQIDPAAVKLIGPGGDEDASDSANLTDDHLIVKFDKSQVITLIPDPKAGDKHPIVVTDDTASFQFQFTIEIVGKKD